MKLTSLILLIVILQSAPVLSQEPQFPTSIEFPTDNGFLPSNWTKDPIKAEIVPLKRELQEQAKEIIAKALEKYPDQLKVKYLKGISIVGSLKFYHVRYGGTYMAQANRVVLVYRKIFSSTGFEQRFHHEFSSILLKMNQEAFENKRWESSNPTDFVYLAGGIIEEKKGDISEATKALAAEQKKTGGSGSTLLRLSPALMKEGFLTQYNRVSVEQDVNETAAHLFTNPEIWNLCERYPRLDQKIDVLIDFYRALDPKMDRLFFRELTKFPETIAESATTNP